MITKNTGYVPSSSIKGEGGITVSMTGAALRISGTGSGVGTFAFQVLGLPNPFSGPGFALTDFEVHADVVHGWVDQVKAFYIWAPNDTTAIDLWRSLPSVNPKSDPGRWLLVGDTLALASRLAGLDDGAMLTSASNALGALAGTPTGELQGGTIELRSTGPNEVPAEFTLQTPWIMTGPCKLSIRGNPDVRFHSTLAGGLGAAIQVIPGQVGVLVSTTLAAPTTGDSAVITTGAPIAPGREIRIEEAGVLSQTYQVLSAAGNVLTLDRTVLNTFTVAATVKTLSRARVKIDGQGMTISGTGDGALSTESTVDLQATNLNWDPIDGTPSPSSASYFSRGDFFADVSNLRCALAGAGPMFGVNVVSGEQVSVRHSAVEDIAPGVLNACYHFAFCHDCELVDSLSFMTPFASGDGVQIEASQDVRVRGCALEGGTFGVDIKANNRRPVIESTRTSENNGISAINCLQPRIAQCSCVHNGAAISLTGCEGGVIEGCAVEHDDQAGNGVAIAGAGRTMISDLTVTRCSVGVSITGSDVDMCNVLLLDNSQAGINMTGSPTQIVRISNLTARAGLGTAATWRGVLLNGYGGKLYIDSSQITMNVAGQTAIRHVAVGPVTDGIVVLSGNHTWTESVAGTFGYFQDVGVTGTMRRTGRHDYAVTTPITKALTGFLNIDVVVIPGAAFLSVPWPDLRSTDHINLESQGGIIAPDVPSITHTPGVGFDITATAGTTWQYQVNS